jgi:hypothetical protein
VTPADQIIIQRRPPIRRQADVSNYVKTLQKFLPIAVYLKYEQGLYTFVLHNKKSVPYGQRKSLNSVGATLSAPRSHLFTDQKTVFNEATGPRRQLNHQAQYVARKLRRTRK